MTAIRSQSALLEKLAGRVRPAQSKPQSIVRCRAGRAEQRTRCTESIFMDSRRSCGTGNDRRRILRKGWKGPVTRRTGPAQGLAAWTDGRVSHPERQALRVQLRFRERRYGAVEPQQVMSATCNTWMRFQTRQNGQVRLSRSPCAGIACIHGHSASRKTGSILSHV